MFTCSNCGHQIDDSRVPVPPFCPRCGEATGQGAMPFDDDDDDGAIDSPLPPPPPMGGPLPPPPPMGGGPRARSGGPSKTLFGMPGLDFGSPSVSESGADFAFPTDDDDGA